MADILSGLPANVFEKGTCVGVTRDGSTLPIEVNGGCAIDPCGLQHGLYAKLLSTRWTELAGVPEERAF